MGSNPFIRQQTDMVKLVNTLVLETDDSYLEGSSPSIRTKKMRYIKNKIRLSWNKYNIYNLLEFKNLIKGRKKKKIAFKRSKFQKVEKSKRFVLKNFSKDKNRNLIEELEKKNTTYKKQLQTKQQLRFLYCNLREHQFAKLFKLKGIILLEKRLDTILYRMNFTKSLFESRQLINHGHVLVNNKIIKSASHLLKEGDLVQIKQDSILFMKKAFKLPKIKDIITLPKYLEVNYKNFSGILISEPQVNEIPLPFKIKFKHIYNYYSRA